MFPEQYDMRGGKGEKGALCYAGKDDEEWVWRGVDGLFAQVI